MARILVLLLVLGTGAAGLAALFARSSEAAPAAAIQRTFVSTSGDDANACTRTEPCRGFTAALVNTLPGGEVVALDSGGYGPVIVDKAVSLIGAPGAHVAISVFVGDGITINAGASDVVVLRNLHLTGLGGTNGIRFTTGGRLYVDSVSASGFSSRGLRAAASPGGSTVTIRNSLFRQNVLGGVLLNASTGSLRGEIEATRADGNGDKGFHFFGPVTGTVVRAIATGNAGAGFYIQDGGRITIVDSTADGNNLGGVDVEGADSQVGLDGVVLTNNAFGVFLAAGTFARIEDSTVTGSSIGLWNTAGGTLETLQDNTVRSNGTNVAGAITPVTKT